MKITAKPKLAVVFLAYLLLALVFTYPLAKSLTSHGFGVDEDAPYHIWHNWWLKFSLFDLKTSPLTTDYIFFPQKIPLIYDANSFIFGLLTLPLQILFDPLLSSNLVFLASFALSGFSMFLLTNFLTRNKAIAFFTGVVFAFSPYTLAQASDGHTNLTTTWIIPLYTLFLIKSLQARTFANIIVTGILASAQLYSDFTYTAFLILQTGLICLLDPLRTSSSLFPYFQRSFRNFILATKILFVAGLLSFPLLFEINHARRLGIRPGSPLWVQNEWSGDFLSFFRPPDQATLLKVFSYTPPRGSVEGTVFLGFTLTGLFLLTLLRRGWGRNVIRASEGEEGWERLFFWLSGLFFLLSLGPTLHVGGRYLFNFLGIHNFLFPLPFLLLHKIPLVGEVQEPTRLNPFLMMSLSLTVGLFLAKTKLFSEHRWKSFSLVLTLTLLSIGEYLSIPFPLTNLETPPTYKKIREDFGSFSVLTLPVGFNSGQVALGKSPIGSLQYYQVAHQHPAFRGTVARLPAWAFEYYQKIPFFNFLLDSSSDIDDVIFDHEKARRTFSEELRIKYVVIHKDKYDSAQLRKVRRAVETILRPESLDEEEKTFTYRLW